MLLLIAALAGAGLAVRSARDGASRQRTENVSVRLAAQSTALEAADPATAALLAGAAWRIAPTAQARYSLLQSLAQPVRGVLGTRAGAVTALVASPDGKTLAAAYPGGTIRLWDVASHRLISTATWRGRVLALAFAGHGKSLVVAGPGGHRDLGPGERGEDNRAAAGRELWRARFRPARFRCAGFRARPRPLPSPSARTERSWPPAARTGTSGSGTSPPSRRSARR